MGIEIKMLNLPSNNLVLIYKKNIIFYLYSFFYDNISKIAVRKMKIILMCEIPSIL